MKQTLLASAVMMNILALGSQPARATILTFDDLVGNENPVPNGYGGFDWNNQTSVGLFDAADYGFQNTGYNYGTVSGGNVIFNYGGASPVEISLAEAGTFTYIGAFFTAAWVAETVSFAGLLNGVVVDISGSYDITTTYPLFIELDWTGINDLIISNTGQQWAMDNFTFTTPVTTVSDGGPVPEPTSMMLLGAGLVGFGILKRRPVI